MSRPRPIAAGVGELPSTIVAPHGSAASWGAAFQAATADRLDAPAILPADDVILCRVVDLFDRWGVDLTSRKRHIHEPFFETTTAT